MKGCYVVGVSLAMAVLLIPSASAIADYYDDFADGWFRRDANDPQYDDANYHTYDYVLWRWDPNDTTDPNDWAHAYWTDPNNAVYWDADNPDWSLFLMAYEPQVHIITDSVADTALRVAGGELSFPTGMGSIAVGVISNAATHDTDPTWFDDTDDHYVLAWVYYTGYYHPAHEDPNKRFSFNDPNYDPNYDDPGEDRGRAFLIMHSEGMAGLSFSIDFDDNAADHPGAEGLQLQSFSGQIDPDKAAALFRRIWIDPNDPDWALYPNQPYGCPILRPNDETLNPYNGPDFGGENLDDWERSGFWMLFQFDNDGTAPPGDPNV